MAGHVSSWAPCCTSTATHDPHAADAALQTMWQGLLSCRRPGTSPGECAQQAVETIPRSDFDVGEFALWITGLSMQPVHSSAAGEPHLLAPTPGGHDLLQALTVPHDAVWNHGNCTLAHAV